MNKTINGTSTDTNSSLATQISAINNTLKTETETDVNGNTTIVGKGTLAIQIGEILNLVKGIAEKVNNNN